MKFASDSPTYISLGLPVGLFIGGKLSKNPEMVMNSYELLSSTILTSLLTTAMKYGFHRERPFETYPNDITKHSTGGSYSFPSGHTSMVFSTATSLSLMYPKWYIIAPSFAWASVVAYSRMYLGVHYPSDVLAGALLGCLTSVGTHYLFNYIKKRKNEKEKVKL